MPRERERNGGMQIEPPAFSYALSNGLAISYQLSAVVSRLPLTRWYYRQTPPSPHSPPATTSHWWFGIGLGAAEALQKQNRRTADTRTRARVVQGQGPEAIKEATWPAGHRTSCFRFSVAFVFYSTFTCSWGPAGHARVQLMCLYGHGYGWIAI
jgi:hypothetical protein